MLSTGVYDTLWLTLIIVGVGGLAFALSLLVKLKADRSTRRQRWGRHRSSRDRIARDA